MMLKPLLVIIALLVMGISSYAQNPFSPYNDIKPKGKIDTVIISGNGDGQHVYVYNKQRQLVEHTWYIDKVFHDSGRLFDTIKTFFTYGANKHLISSKMIFKGGKTSTATYKYLPTKYGYAIRVTDSRDKDSSIVSEMRFDHSGRVIQCGYYALNDLEKQQEGNLEYKYDEKGHISQRIAYYNPIHEWFYKYNNDGDVIVLTKGTPPDTADYTYTYSQYDKMHNWTEQTVYLENGNKSLFYRRITYYK